MTRSDQSTLYILSNAQPGDPLDCVAAAMPLLALNYAKIQQVGPHHDLSLRALRRAYEPTVDRLLYDFTAPDTHNWAFDMLRDAPAAVLLGNYRAAAPIGALADLRSAQRYAALGHRFSIDVTIGVLDATADPLTIQSILRPAAFISPSPDIIEFILAVTPGEIETAYAALVGLRGQGASLTILTALRRDANELPDIIAAFGMPDARVRYVRNRAGLVAALTGAGGVIDIGDEARLGLSNAAFVAACLGAPVLTLNTPDGAGEVAEAFAVMAPDRDPIAAKEFKAARPLEPFAGDLHALIEAGFAHAKQAAAA